MSEAAATPTAQVTTPAAGSANTPAEVKSDAGKAEAAAGAVKPETKPAGDQAQSAPADGKAKETKAEPEAKTETKTETKEPEKKPAAPEKYELKLPKGSLMDQARLEKIADFAKSKGLSNEDAQALVEREHDAVSSYVEDQAKALKERSSAWVEELKSDKDIGGTAFKENIEHAKRALSEFGTPALNKILNETGLGNHPELVRTFVRIGKLTAPDKMVRGEKDAGNRSLAERLYGEPQS